MSWNMSDQQGLFDTSPADHAGQYRPGRQVGCPPCWLADRLSGSAGWLGPSQPKVDAGPPPAGSRHHTTSHDITASPSASGLDQLIHTTPFSFPSLSPYRLIFVRLSRATPTSSKRGKGRGVYSYLVSRGPDGHPRVPPGTLSFTSMVLGPRPACCRRVRMISYPRLGARIYLGIKTEHIITFAAEPLNIGNRCVTAVRK